MMLVDARFIHCRHDLMDTKLSCFKNHFIGARLDYTCDLEALGAYYRHYDALMAYWREVLPGEIYESTYETLVARPETEIPKLLESLSLPFEVACLSFHKTERLVATASMSQVRRPIHQRSERKWQKFSQELQPLQDALDATVSQ